MESGFFFERKIDQNHENESASQRGGRSRLGRFLVDKKKQLSTNFVFRFFSENGKKSFKKEKLGQNRLISTPSSHSSILVKNTENYKNQLKV